MLPAARARASRPTQQLIEEDTAVIDLTKEDSLDELEPRQKTFT